MVVKHLNLKRAGRRGEERGERGDRGRGGGALVVERSLLSNLSVVVLLCWLGTMRLHVEDMFTTLHLRLGGEEEVGGERRGGRRQKDGIREKEREAEMMTKVYIVKCSEREEVGYREEAERDRRGGGGGREQ